MKFVIHFHTGSKEQQDHYDFMLEQETTLATWQIASPDMALLTKGATITAMKIHDHRKQYLSYEGPISCDRGMVNIFDSGEYTTINNENGDLIIELYGAVLKGKMNIAPITLVPPPCRRHS